MARIILTPVFMALYITGQFFDGWTRDVLAAAAVFVFILAAASDSLDGYIARSRNLITDTGKFLDSIADKLLVACALCLVIGYNPYAEFPVLATLTVAYAAISIARDFIISGLRQIAATKGLIVAADKFGKVKAAVQMVALPVILIAGAGDRLIANAGFDGHILLFAGFGLLSLSTLLAVLSCGNYLIKHGGVFKEERN
jgi:CDP-diacylglycerol--glycerol-3-phosphate 3-phosphatidyltransferase